MYACRVVIHSFFFSCLLAGSSRLAAAQEGHQHPPPAAQEHSQHHPSELGLFAPREASGTSWLPDATPMYGIHQQAGAWQLMWHGNLFGQFLYESGDRGNEQAGSINWFMGMARRDLSGGQLGFRGMLSLEPLTIPGCGYPDLLATGEICNGEAIHDRQHPHDLFMEVAAEYNRPIGRSFRWQIYGGFAGEPALGPVAYPHRISAMPNPLAPISHHWLDATHITFGVVTGGIYNERWKAEGSLFNGREPDEERWNIALAPLDSFSGRVWFAPASTLALQISAGRLTEAEAGHDGEPRVDVTRLTASATYHRQFGAGSIWATTAAWGRNAEGDDASHAFLIETNITFDDRHSWFGRFEAGGKSAHDLDIPGADEEFTVAKLQAGYTRYLNAWRGLRPGFGGGGSLGFVPARLEPIYGSRVNAGIALFLTLRPDAHRM
ncbi:MAG: hypothetical protein WBC51_01990 [Vicinamibacterales bacterium]